MDWAMRWVSLIMTNFPSTLWWGCHPEYEMGGEERQIEAYYLSETREYS